MNTSTGKSTAAAATEMISVIPALLVPTNGAQLPPHSSGPVVLISLTSVASDVARSAASWPTIAIRLSGDASASRPIVPTTVAGNRSASWAAGACPSSSASAGDTYISPAAGSSGMPGGIGASGPVGARSTRPMSSPSKTSPDRRHHRASAVSSTGSAGSTLPVSNQAYRSF
jgi:hypothetical protein